MLNMTNKCSAFVQKSTFKVGRFQDGLPMYTAEEVAEHNTIEKGIWSTYNEGVYDITDYIDDHPGGREIIMAAGASLEPFWEVYTVHEHDNVYRLLEEMRIGNLKIDVSGQGKDDPYQKEPVRSSAKIPVTLKPYNAGAPAPKLVENFITPTDLFYVRNHLPVPDLDPKEYRVEVRIEGSSEKLIFTLDDIKNMPKHTVTITLLCAGNRRTEMIKVKPVIGVPWPENAISNATWTGAKLCDILKRLNVSDEHPILKHVNFEAYSYGDAGSPYAASIPIWRAMDKRCDVLLAYEMNGEALTRDHGFPLRVVVPGVVGCRHVKWLAKIIVSEFENCSAWYQKLYKNFSPSIDSDKKVGDYTKTPAIQEAPVTSGICQPCEDDRVQVVDGCIYVKGYAWSGGGLKILRVNVTVDAGKTWYDAQLDHQDSASPPWHWAWTLWSIRIPVQPNLQTIEIWSKAVDSWFNTQPDTFENIWNFKGVLCHAYHRVKVNLDYKL